MKLIIWNFVQLTIWNFVQLIIWINDCLVLQTFCRLLDAWLFYCRTLSNCREFGAADSMNPRWFGTVDYLTHGCHTTEYFRTLRVWLHNQWEAQPMVSPTNGNVTRGLRPLKSGWLSNAYVRYRWFARWIQHTYTPWKLWLYSPEGLRTSAPNGYSGTADSLDWQPFGHSGPFEPLIGMLLSSQKSREFCCRTDGYWNPELSGECQRLATAEIRMGLRGLFFPF